MGNMLENINLNQLYSDSPEAVVILDNKGSIISSNATFLRMIKAGTGLIGNPFSDCIWEKNRKGWNEVYSKFVNGEKNFARIISRHKIEKISSLRWWQINLKRIVLDNTPISILTISDITNIKLMEHKHRLEMDAVEKAAEVKTQFLANTSHEIRTPIHTIIAVSELLTSTELDPEQSEYTGQIKFAADVLLSLVNDILDISKMEAGKLEIAYTWFDLKKLVDQLVSLTTLEAHKKGIEVGVEIGRNVPVMIYSDPVRINQILVNLINNAIKFTKVGQVTIKIVEESRDNEHSLLYFEVADSGIGIPFEKQSRLFNAFQQADSTTTRKFGGTGLGLYISKNLVERLGGELKFRSLEKRGSTFFFNISTPSQLDTTENIIPSGFFDGTTVLLVDDNPVIRAITANYIISWGCIVKECSSAIEALELLRSEDGKSIDVTLVDQHMVGIDGWQFASEVHSDSSINHHKLILMTLQGAKSTAEEAKMKLLGWFKGYIAKPLRVESLVEKIFMVLTDNPAAVIDGETDLEELESYRDSEDSMSGKILIVEDFEVNKEIFGTMLSKLGLDSDYAENGLEAVEKVTENDYDIIFMDCQMPIMNGYEATSRIRMMGRKTPIIAVTASAISQERERCIQAGMDDMLSKPFKINDLMPFLNQYLNSSKIEIPEETKVKDENHEVDIMVDRRNIFDLNAAIETLMGNRKKLFELIPRFITRVETQISEIQTAKDVKDWKALSESAHGIKGGARNLDMNRLGFVAEKLEMAGKEEDTESIPPLIDEIYSEFDALKDLLDIILKGNPQ